jgi:hypothetical protein
MVADTRPRGLTWELLSSLDQRLCVVLADAKIVRDERCSPWWCREEHGLNFRKRLRRLVGFSRSSWHAVLSTPEAADVAEAAVFDALPPCRGACPCGSRRQESDRGDDNFSRPWLRGMDHAR